MKTKAFKQKVHFSAAPWEVYESIMDAKKHSRFTGENLELVKDKKIVQKWRASDWCEGVYSRVSFLFSPAKGGTDMVLIQSEIPADKYSEIKSGWTDYYCKPLKAMLAES